jgi:hypothetical protein
VVFDDGIQSRHGQRQAPVSSFHDQDRLEPLAGLSLFR